MINCSLGIMAYNEQANIGHLLQAVLNQKYKLCNLTEIFVVASGCTDNTVKIAQSYAKKDSRIQVLIQPQRCGKASAINLFIEHATGDILIVESGDTIPAATCYEELVNPFLKHTIGMVGARPVPVNNPKTFLGSSVHFLWGLHHLLASQNPKLGELIAFRNTIKKIPEKTAVDEASIEQMITADDYHLAYVPDAIVYNKGPETISDFLKQRRRIANGHMHLARTTNYSPSTTSTTHTLKVIHMRLCTHLARIGKFAKKGKPALFLAYLCREALRAIWAIGAIKLDVIGRLLGWYDFNIKHKNPVSW